MSALGFILRGMRSDIRELGSKVDTILFALVHAGLLSPQQVRAEGRSEEGAADG